jgi:hypothetical protein
VNTGGYGGKTLHKNVTVYTNDQQHPRLSLSIQGDVQAVAEVQPRYVNLRGFVGEEIKRTVRIVPEPKFRFRILEVKARRGDNIRFELTEDGSEADPGYTLTVENAKTDEGRYQDTLTLLTDSSIKPRIDISVFGYLRNRPAGGQSKSE